MGPIHISLLYQARNLPRTFQALLLYCEKRIELISGECSIELWAVYVLGFLLLVAECHAETTKHETQLSALPDLIS